MASKIALFAALIGAAFSAPTSAPSTSSTSSTSNTSTYACPCMTNAVASNSSALAATVTGVNLNLPSTAFGSAIEGVSVNHKGDVFAVDFRNGSQHGPALTYGYFHKTNTGTRNILNGSNPLMAIQNDSPNVPLLAGARFLSDGSVLLTDANNSRVLRANDIDGRDTYTYCSDPKMLQPNDLALNSKRESIIYLSGQNYSLDTTAGVSGDLWTCDGSIATKFPSSILKAADIHRTNGIETSHCGQYLYLSSAKNVNGTVTSNKIFRFEIAKNGSLARKAPTLFHDFIDTAAVDIDAMRVDVCGNLFVTRNGNGTIAQLSPEGKLLKTIVLPGMGGPSSLEFGGRDGKTLFAVGKCAAPDATVGCAASWEAEVPGRAWARLQQHKREPAAI
ncbi:hypothetical protein H2203_004444 [Taxawa tesnikishii (nom. ined.)]|nr:hypothetical protein H2203_004444 [Dothideales sp. JES 119]